MENAPRARLSYTSCFPARHGGGGGGLLFGGVHIGSPPLPTKAVSRRMGMVYTLNGQRTNNHCRGRREQEGTIYLMVLNFKFNTLGNVLPHSPELAHHHKYFLFQIYIRVEELRISCGNGF